MGGIGPGPMIQSGGFIGMGGFTPSDVPQAEADALIAFYVATNGPNWTDNTGWTTDTTVGNWYGVTVSGGHVTELDLAGDANVDGDGLRELSPLTSLTYLRLYNTSVSGGTIGTMTEMENCQVQDCGWTEANVDALLADMYAERANFTDATPELNIGGTNAAPSGTYQDGDPPTTGLEYVYELANDPEGEGFNSWSITYTGGSAP